MILPECMRLLGLDEATSVEEIKRAYRRLAQQLHPDKRSGDEAASQQFIEISQAYRMLVNAARGVEQGKPVGVCYDCRDFGEVKIGLDGHARCGRCIFRPVGGRLLPLPIWVVVRCTATLVFLGVGIYLLTLSIAGAGGVCAAGAAIAGLIGLATLATTCLRVKHCLQPRDRARMNKDRGA